MVSQPQLPDGGDLVEDLLVTPGEVAPRSITMSTSSSGGRNRVLHVGQLDV